MNHPVESPPLRPSTRRANLRRARWRRSLESLGRDIRRHPALASLLTGYVLIYLVAWWFFLTAPAPGVLDVGEGLSPVAGADSELIDSSATVLPERNRAFLPPQPGAPLGTDQQGVDVLTRVLRGAAESLSAALLGATGAVAIGVCVVFTAGLLLGSRGYIVLEWLAGGLTCLPAIALVWWLSAALEPGFLSVTAVIAVSGAVVVVDRLGRVFSEAEEAWHSVAAVAVGMSRISVLWTQVLPGVRHRLVSYGAMLLPGAVLLETALTFAGLGLGPGAADSWGRLIAEGRPLMLNAPWMVIAPGLVVAFTVGWLALTARSIRKVTREKDFLSLV